MKNQDEQRKAMRRDQLQLIALLIAIGAFIAFIVRERTVTELELELTHRINRI